MTSSDNDLPKEPKPNPVIDEFWEKDFDILKDRASMTIHIAGATNAEMEKYLRQRQALLGEKMPKQQFIETAIMRELARVRGKDPEKVPDAPNFQKLAAKRRRGTE